MGVGLVESQLERVVPQIWNQAVVGRWGILAIRLRVYLAGQDALRRQIDLAVVALVPVLVAHVSHGQYGSRSQRLLQAKAVLGARRQSVAAAAYAGNTGNDDRQRRHMGA